MGLKRPIWLLIAGWCLIACPAALAAWAQFQAATPSAASGWSQLYMGAGGMLTSLDIGSDGTTVTRTDTYGSWIAKPRTAGWYSSINATNSAASDLGLSIETRIAPSNTAIIYEFRNNGYIYKSTNRAITWAQTSFPQQTGLDGDWGNSENIPVKQASPYMAIDPQDPTVVLASAPTTNKLIYTSDSFAHTTAITNGAGGIPASTTFSGATHPGGFLVCFDPTSTVTSGKTQGIFASSWGNGIYHSTDGGSTWAALSSSGMPTTATQIVCDQFGNLWVVDGSNGGNKGTLSVYAHAGSSIFTGSAWTTDPASFSNGAVTVAIDPAQVTEASSRVFVANDTRAFFKTSTSGGAVSSWTSQQTPTLASSGVSWLTNVTEPGFIKMMFDPSLSNTLLITSGVGIWYANPPTDGSSAWTWTEQNGKGTGSTGIEELVVNWIISPAGGYPVLANWDRPVFTITDQSVYPSGYGPNYGNAIADSFSVDWASATPGTVTMSGFPVTGSTQVQSVSSNKGVAWTAWGNVPTGNQGGGIAASTTTNWVMFPASNGDPAYTTDGAATSWNSLASYFNSTYSIPTGGSENGWGGYYGSFRGQTPCADRGTSANTFYAHNYLTSPAVNGFYRTTNSGAAWTKFSDISYPVFGNAGIKPLVECAPKLGSYDTTGHVFFNPGLGSASPMPLYRSTNGTTSLTFSAVPNVTDVIVYGFGAPKPGGGGYPAIYVYGKVDQGGGPVLGFWRSDNGEQATPTWTFISTYANNSLDQVNAIQGDGDTWGKFYVGFAGIGAAKYLPYLLKRDLDPAANDNTPLGLNKVA